MQIINGLFRYGVDRHLKDAILIGFESNQHRAVCGIVFGLEGLGPEFSQPRTAFKCLKPVLGCVLRVFCASLANLREGVDLFNGNPHQLEQDVLVRHGEKIIQLENRSFEGIRAYLEQHCIEGIVFWKDGMPGCKIKRRDFGFMWPEAKAISHDSEKEV